MCYCIIVFILSSLCFSLCFVTCLLVVMLTGGLLEDEASVQFVSVVFKNLPGTQAGLMTATVA